MKGKPTVGQVVFTVFGYRGNDTEKKADRVASVGRLYFTLEGRQRHRFHNSNWKQESGCPHISLYEAESEYLEEQEANRIRKTLREMFAYDGAARNLSLEQLRRIEAILKELPPK